jgi:hypothetical protein
MKAGFLPWLDERDLRPGLPWVRALEAAISKIKSAAVFIGPGGHGPWQREEIELILRDFIRREGPVIPVLLPSAVETPNLPGFLGNRHWVDFRRAEPNPLQQLIYGITGRHPGQDNP